MFAIIMNGSAIISKKKKTRINLMPGPLSDVLKYQILEFKAISMSFPWKFNISMY